jgi:hypothetical protein
LFKPKSGEDDDDEAVSAPVPTAQQVADAAAALASANKAADTKAAGTKIADAAARTKSKALAAFQLASADSQVSVAKPAPADNADASGTRPQTPAEIINARGFWGDAAPNPATAAQIAAIKAREAVATADPQSTGSVSAAMQALAYAPPANSPVDRANIVAASVPVLRSPRPAPRNAAAVANEINSIAAKGAQGQVGVVATSTRISAGKGNDIWLRVMMLAPSASDSMFTTVLGDTDMTVMKDYFAKPRAAVAMGFSDDPQPGLPTDRFTGSAVSKLALTSFATASLR